MVATGTEMRVQELAQQLFDLIAHFCLNSPRGRRRNGDLKEVEFLTLSLLHHHETLIVGDIQRQLGVLPAQMSRIIRSLETRQHPLIACRINPQDKRKIDVALTAEGMAAFLDHQSSHIGSICNLLGKLSEDDLEDLQRLLGKLHEVVGSPALG
ncbi:MAG: MarR family winged helix-turn-helix transcriptional regulator [Gemmataceae bacterium]